MLPALHMTRVRFVRDPFSSAFVGLRADGNAYIQEALERGAVAVITDSEGRVPGDRPVARVPDARTAAACVAAVLADKPATAMRMYAIGGTNGKTTTSYMFAIRSEIMWRLGRHDRNCGL